VSNTPSLENPSPSRYNIEVCKDAGFNFQKFTAANVKSLVHCLSGSTQSLKPLEEFLNSAQEQDLNLLFDSLNKHWPWASRRQKEVLELIREMQKRGHLREALKNFEVLTRTKFISSTAKLAMLGLRDHSPSHADENLKVLLKDDSLSASG
jgi:hypothetical protein